MHTREAEALMDILKQMARDKEGQMHCRETGEEQARKERQIKQLQKARLVESLGPQTMGITREGYSFLVAMQDKQNADAFRKAIHGGNSLKKAVAAMQQLAAGTEA